MYLTHLLCLTILTTLYVSLFLQFVEEDFLLQQSVRFETLKQLEDTLDSEHIKGS